MIGVELHEKIVRYRQAHPGTSYAAAWKAVERLEPRVVQRYLAEVESVATGSEEALTADFLEGGKRAAGMELDQRVKRMQQRQPGLGYGPALALALKADPPLAEQWRTGVPRVRS